MSGTSDRVLEWYRISVTKFAQQESVQGSQLNRNKDNSDKIDIDLLSST